MSDAMLLGVLRMPYELAMCTELHRRQFYARAQEAASALERLHGIVPEVLEKLNDELRAENEKLRGALKRVKYEAISLSDAQVIALEALGPNVAGNRPAAVGGSG